LNFPSFHFYEIIRHERYLTCDDYSQNFNDAIVYISISNLVEFELMHFDECDFFFKVHEYGAIRNLIICDLFNQALIYYFLSILFYISSLKNFQSKCRYQKVSDAS